MKPCTAVLVVVSLLVLPVDSVLAQNRFFDDGTNGITVQGGWATSGEADGFGGAAVLTFNGRLDLGVSYLAPKIEIEPGYSQDWQEITPRMAIAVVRPRQGFPVGVDVAASYTSIKFGGTLQDLAGGNARTFGIDVSGRFGGGPTLQLVPAFGVHYMKSEAWVRQQVEDNKLTMSESGPMVAVECALLVAERFFIVPATVGFEGDTTWSITAGFALEME